MGPALESACSLEALVVEGESRVKMQGNEAVGAVFYEVDQALKRLKEKPSPMKNKIQQRLSKSLKNGNNLWRFKYKGH